jgi:hypothetical protein
MGQEWAVMCITCLHKNHYSLKNRQEKSFKKPQKEMDAGRKAWRDL